MVVALLHLLVRTELVVMEQIQLHQSAHLHRNRHQMNPNSIKDRGHVVHACSMVLPLCCIYKTLSVMVAVMVVVMEDEEVV